MSPASTNFFPRYAALKPSGVRVVVRVSIRCFPKASKYASDHIVFIFMELVFCGVFFGFLGAGGERRKEGRGGGGLSVEARQILFRIPAEVTYFVVLIDKQGVQPNKAPAFWGETRRVRSTWRAPAHLTGDAITAEGSGGTERRVPPACPLNYFNIQDTTMPPLPPLYSQQLHKLT